MRTCSLVHYLARDFDLDLILFRQAGDSDPALSLPPGLVRRSDTVTLPFHSRRAAAWIVRNGYRWLKGVPPLLDRFGGQADAIGGILGGRKYELGIIEHFWCAPYVEQLSIVCRRIVLDLHNVESALHNSCAKTRHSLSGLAHRRFARACLDLERRWLPRFWKILTPSESDARRLPVPADVYPNALPLFPIPAAPEDDAIGFSANFEYHPNVAGVRFLLGEIWPVLHRRFPSLKLRLIGKNPHMISRYVSAAPNVETTGAIEDAIRELGRVKIAVVPLLSGSGTRIKILEAWAAAKPVISTTVGAEGIGIQQDRDILIADTAHDFIESVTALLGSLERRRRMGCAARHKYEEEFTWEKAWEKLQLR